MTTRKCMSTTAPVPRPLQSTDSRLLGGGGLDLSQHPGLALSPMPPSYPAAAGRLAIGGLVVEGEEVRGRGVFNIMTRPSAQSVEMVHAFCSGATSLRNHMHAGDITRGSRDHATTAGPCRHRGNVVSPGSCSGSVSPVRGATATTVFGRVNEQALDSTRAS